METKGARRPLNSLTPQNSKPLPGLRLQKLTIEIKGRDPPGKCMFFTFVHTQPGTDTFSSAQPFVCIRINLQKSLTKTISLCFTGLQGISKVLLVRHDFYDADMGCWEIEECEGSPRSLFLGIMYPQTQNVYLVLSATSVVKYREEKSQEKVRTSIGVSYLYI